MNGLLTLWKQCFTTSLPRIGLTFTFIKFNKISVEDSKLCRHIHGHHGQAATSISVIVQMKVTGEIAVHDHIKTRCIDLNHTGDDSDLQFLCSSVTKKLIFGQKT